MTDDRRKLNRIKPLPPEPIPAQPPSLDLPPTDYRGYIMGEKIKSLKEKTLIRKGPLLSMTFTVIAFVFSKVLGLDVDLGSIIDVANGLQLGELIFGLGAVISAYLWDRKESSQKPSNG